MPTLQPLSSCSVRHPATPLVILSEAEGSATPDSHLTSCPMSLKQGHLANIRAFNLPDVPPAGTPGKHPGLKPARCPSGGDTWQTFGPLTCPMSLRRGHLANIRAFNLPDVPPAGTPGKHSGLKPARCPFAGDTWQYSGLAITVRRFTEIIDYKSLEQ